VFHLAGVVQDKMVWSQTRDAAEALLAPKVEGTRALLATLGDREVGFIALFSSYVSQFGRAGQSDYAAANAFLDQVAWEQRDLPIISLDWFPWSIGMAGSAAYQKAARSQGLIPLHPASAFDAMLGVIASGHRQVVMAATQPDQRSSIHDQFQSVTWERAEPVAARVKSKTRGAAAGGVATATSDIDQFLREQLSVQLKVAPDAVDINEPFPMMGLESLTAVNLIREIEDRYDLALYPTLLFEITTVAELTRYLAGRLAGTGE
jgi:acyl carrier protein